MLDSGLPLAAPLKKTIKLGNIVVKPKEPTQSIEDAKKGLETLKKAAQEKVFIEDESAE